MERKKITAFIIFVAFCLAVLSFAAFGQTVPESPLNPPKTGLVRVIYQNAYVYSSEIVTNADDSTTWVKYATVTNTVDAYAPMLVIKVKAKNELTGAWEYTGKEFVALLGTNAVEFYTAELSIQ